jgi:hypothetical protein
MLDNTSRKMLKYLADEHHNPTGGMLFVDFYDKYPKYANMSEHQAMACIRYLENQGYIKFGKSQSDMYVGFELEHKAYKRFAFARNALYEFLAKSVLVPIIVTLLTMLIVNELQALL